MPSECSAPGDAMATAAYQGEECPYRLVSDTETEADGTPKELSSQNTTSAQARHSYADAPPANYCSVAWDIMRRIVFNVALRAMRSLLTHWVNSPGSRGARDYFNELMRSSTPGPEVKTVGSHLKICVGKVRMLARKNLTPLAAPCREREGERERERVAEGLGGRLPCRCRRWTFRGSPSRIC